MATHSLTAQGDSAEYRYNGGTSTFAFFGNFDGNTLKVQASLDDGVTFIDLKDATGSTLEVTADEINNISLGFCIIRYNLSGGNASPAVTVEIH